MNKAEYYATKKTKMLIITKADGTEYSIKVSGKVEARKVASEHNAKAWNF